jgi:hypothetical protein
MKENYMKKFNLEIKINNCLDGILKYTNSAYDYLTVGSSKIDKYKLIDYMSEFPEAIKYIKELIWDLEGEYEKERENYHEQL